MENNTEKTTNEIKMWLGFIVDDAQEVLEKINPQADDNTLDHLWRLCELIGEMAYDARVLIGKMSDERENTEGA